MCQKLQEFWIWTLSNYFPQQSEKKQILRRLNQNLKAQSSAEEVEPPTLPPAEPTPAPQQIQCDTEKRPPSNGDRKKWDAADVPVLPVAQQTLTETCATTAGNGSPRRTSLSKPIYQQRIYLHGYNSTILCTLCWGCLLAGKLTVIS